VEGGGRNLTAESRSRGEDRGGKRYKVTDEELLITKLISKRGDARLGSRRLGRQSEVVFKMVYPGWRPSGTDLPGATSWDPFGVARLVLRRGASVRDC
jgi:hypothetical protein